MAEVTTVINSSPIVTDFCNANQLPIAYSEVSCCKRNNTVFSSIEGIH